MHIPNGKGNIRRTTAHSPFPFLILLLLALVGGLTAGPCAAQSGERIQYLAQEGMVHVWTLKAWKDNALLCEIYRQDEATPDGTDIAAYCGQKVYQKWVSSPPCSTFVENGKTDGCEGSYLTYLGYYYRNYQSYETLPLASITFSIEGCRLGEWCSQAPVITFTAAEPLAGHSIVEIAYESGGTRNSCYESDTCHYRVPITQQEGMWLDYWAVSSYGDESQHHTLHLRNLYRGANGGEYLLDILSPTASSDFAAQTWDIFPTKAHPEGELFHLTASEAELLTHHELFYLAGKLIFTGEVDARACVGSGLLGNNMANTCGQEAAAEESLDWQNRYNSQLFQAARTYQLPPRLVKALIAQESQFWPDPGIQYEYGLGSLSENGVDVLLAWDVSSYLALCAQMYQEDSCAPGYASLSADQRAGLRGLALQAVGTDDEIDLITRVLRANVSQVTQTLDDLVDQPLALLTSYEDLWYFTLVNYHAGNSCLSGGLKSLVESEQDLNFENYCALASNCPTACLFVERVRGYGQP